jgi:hypothetical protein
MEDERGRLYSMNKEGGECTQKCGKRPEEKENMEVLEMKGMTIVNGT